MNTSEWKKFRRRTLNSEKEHVGSADAGIRHKIARLEVSQLVAQLLKDYEGYRDLNEWLHVRVADERSFGSEGSVSSTLSVNTNRKIEGLYEQLSRTANVDDAFKSIDLDQEDFTRVSFSPDGRYLIRRVAPFTLNNLNSPQHRDKNPYELDYIKIPETFIYYRVARCDGPPCFVTRGPGFSNWSDAHIKHPHIFERIGGIGDDLAGVEHYSDLYVQDFCTGYQMSVSSNTHGMLISGMTASVFGDVLEAIYRTHNPQSPANSNAFIGDDDNEDYDEEE